MKDVDDNTARALRVVKPKRLAIWLLLLGGVDDAIMGRVAFKLCGDLIAEDGFFAELYTVTIARS